MIDVTHSSVQKLIGHDTDGKPRLAGGKRLQHVAGDPDQGFLATTRLDGGKTEVLCWYKARDLWVTVDVYQVPGEPVKVHFLCPKCENALSIPAHKKHIEFEAKVPNPLYRSVLETPPADWDMEDVMFLRARGVLGSLSTEPFMCTWELKDSHELCRWRAAFDKNIVKDA